jgi:hypothetical protein
LESADPHCFNFRRNILGLVAIKVNFIVEFSYF